ncbi:hypothetical protein JHD50_09405 [Sulfurimonas sp. MAG313]|nr:hypothetical protein [Sulfurimonas sp. MAG313]MDF1881514.1 hypothetical protein [Sulfurimonas sp. MAG313]
MKQILLGLLASLVFIGCNSKEVDPKDLVAKLVINQSVESFNLKDQHDKAHPIKEDTKTLIFAFSKEMGHTCNDFFATKSDTYLEDNNAIFIADVSAAPSVIRSMFIMPGLKDFKHTVLVIDDENIATGYRAGQDSEKIILVSVNDHIITDIKAISSVEELGQGIETK